MKRQIKTLAILALGMALSAASSSLAANLLLNAGLEVTVSPPNWTQMEFITGEPGSPISLSEQLGDANSINDPNAEGNGIYIKPWSGNHDAYDMQNKKINFTLSQTVNAVAGRVYTFKGDARLQSQFSGVVEFLDPFSASDPLNTGTVPSPTVTNMKIEFTNTGGTVLGTHVLDLKTDTTILDDWQTHTLVTPAAPVGTTRARVTVSALDMVDNLGSQRADFDLFSLKDSVSPGSERLQNGNLNTPGSPQDWTLTETPSTSDTASVINFAHHPTVSQPTGNGLWLRAFVGGDALLEQTVAANPGGDYTFSAWTAWETGFSGDSDNPNTNLGGTASKTYLEMTFLDGSSVPIGSTIQLDLDAAGMDGDQDGGNIMPSDWQQFSVNGIAPAGTASIKLGIHAVGMFNSGWTGPQSAFFDDFSLTLATVDGDEDGDGRVDGNDILIIQRGLGTTHDANDITAWKNNFGFGGATAAIGAVPEPGTFASAVIALALAAGAFRRTR